MVSELWIHRVRTSVAAAAMKKKKETSKPPQDGGAGAASTTVGILSFEVANAMSRAVNLYRSLSDSEIFRLRSQIIASPAVRLLVSSDDSYLLTLALAEKLSDLNRVAAVASRLGRRCAHPALVGFEHVYSDLLAGRIDPAGLGFLAKDIDGTIRKMERFVSSTSALYAELEALTALEQGAKKFAQNPVHDATRQVFDQKIQWQRHDVKHLRDASLWNQTHDKVVLLLARAVCTIHSRIRLVFGFPVFDQSSQFSGELVRMNHLPIHSGYLRSGLLEGKPQQVHREENRINCGASPGRFFIECLSLGTSTSIRDGNDPFENESYISKPASIGFSGEQLRNKSARLSRQSVLGPSGGVTTLAMSSTVGSSSLALHYANIIIIIEKLLKYPHLIGEEARDDLYQMLTSSLRAGLRKSLKSYVNNLAIYDAPQAHDWKEALNKILSWLSPMAHDMIRWQTERNFEQQQIILRSNVLLLQTLFFADKEKTEAAICELLVGLNYICRYEQQQNALLDCRSSLDFDDCMDWHVQYDS